MYNNPYGEAAAPQYAELGQYEAQQYETQQFGEQQQYEQTYAAGSATAEQAYAGAVDLGGGWHETRREPGVGAHIQGLCFDAHKPVLHAVTGGACPRPPLRRPARSPCPCPAPLFP